MPSRATVTLAAALAGVVAAKTPSCTSVLAGGSFTGQCTDTWADLQPLITPTQPEVGWAWALYKANKDFTTEADAQAAMDEGATPAVLGVAADGVTPRIYIVDDHHTLSALDYSGFSGVTVSVEITCDLRDSMGFDEMWAFLAANNLAYMAAHPTGEPNAPSIPLKPSQMPAEFAFSTKAVTLSDDPWRSIIGFSRKVRDAPDPAPACADYKYCNRCMYRGCGASGNKASGPAVSFFEFRWSAVALDSYLDGTDAWPSSKQYKAFAASYDALPPASLDGSVDTDAWLATAGLLVPWCRAPETGTMTLPTSLFPEGGPLPGYVEGYEPLDADPTCDAPTCPAAQAAWAARRALRGGA